MSQYGGAAQYGAAQYGGDPFGSDPAYVCDRLVDALSGFQLTATSGSVATIDVLTGPSDDIASLSNQLQAGLPAFLVGYEGGSYLPVTSAGDAFEQTVRYVVVCIADSLRSRYERLAGRNAYRPGLWNMTRWAMFYCARALSKIGSVRSARPLSERFAFYGPEFFVGIVELEAVQSVDIHEDLDSLVLERIGVVHSPTDLNQLFEIDNVTPNTDDPTGAGVFTL